MAKLTGPLLSIGARGAIGKTLVAAEWRGVKYMRQYVIPANPNTTAQQVVRDIFRTLNSAWLISPALTQAPFAANAVGKKYTDRNKYVSENLPAVRGETDMQNFIGSPGALGGPPLEGVAAVAGGLSGEIDVTVTNPTVPTGWTLASVTAMAFPDQDPEVAFGGPIIAGEDLTDPYAITLAGLPAATLCVVSAWPVWTRPDGKTAYGPSLVTTATSTA